MRLRVGLERPVRNEIVLQEMPLGRIVLVVRLQVCVLHGSFGPIQRFMMPPVVEVHFVHWLIALARLPCLIVRRAVTAALRSGLEPRSLLRWHRYVRRRARLQKINLAVRIVRLQIGLLLLINIRKVALIFQKVLSFIISVFIISFLLFLGLLLSIRTLLLAVVLPLTLIVELSQCLLRHQRLLRLSESPVLDFDDAAIFHLLQHASHRASGPSGFVVLGLLGILAAVVLAQHPREPAGVIALRADGPALPCEPPAQLREGHLARFRIGRRGLAASVIHSDLACRGTLLTECLLVRVITDLLGKPVNIRSSVG